MFKKTPEASEIKQSRDCSFMYENFVIATQGAIYLLLKKKGDNAIAYCIQITA
jgi:hypothetical protein